MSSRGLWRGKPIEELTKDELMEAIITIATGVERDRRHHREAMEVLLA